VCVCVWGWGWVCDISLLYVSPLFFVWIWLCFYLEQIVVSLHSPLAVIFAYTLLGARHTERI
jgi:hypothetical protein